jgi:hypothetical protein
MTLLTNENIILAIKQDQAEHKLDSGILLANSQNTPTFAIHTLPTKTKLKLKKSDILIPLQSQPVIIGGQTLHIVREDQILVVIRS